MEIKGRVASPYSVESLSGDLKCHGFSRGTEGNQFLRDIRHEVYGSHRVSQGSQCSLGLRYRRNSSARQKCQKGHMTPEVEGKREFARWFGEWVAKIQQRRASVERLAADERASAEDQRRSSAQTQVLWPTSQVFKVRITENGESCIEQRFSKQLCAQSRR